MDRILCVFLMAFIAGCNDSEWHRLSIDVKSVKMHLTADENLDQEVPPQLYFEFSVRDLNDRVKPYFLSRKASNSKVFIVDTSRYEVIPIALGSTVFEVNDEPSYFMGHINIDEHATYFGLDSNYFRRLDFSSEKDFLREKCKDMLNRSVLIFLQELDGNSKNMEDLKMDGNSFKKSLVVFKPNYLSNEIKIY